MEHVVVVVGSHAGRGGRREYRHGDVEILNLLWTDSKYIGGNLSGKRVDEIESNVSKLHEHTLHERCHLLFVFA